MGGASEFGKCDVCGEDTTLARKYYYYEADCDCCDGHHHFEFVKHCSSCVPEPPTTITVHMKPFSSN